MGYWKEKCVNDKTTTVKLKVLVCLFNTVISGVILVDNEPLIFIGLNNVIRKRFRCLCPVPRFTRDTIAASRIVDRGEKLSPLKPR